MLKAFRFPQQAASSRVLIPEDIDGISEPNPTGAVDIKRHAVQRNVSWPYLIALTCSTGGLQVVWSTIMSNGTPFLITLGLPESLTALVWVAAPLCGVLIQPYVGVLSDRCQLSWGRRRPFIIAGALGTSMSMLCLASTREIVHILARLCNVDAHGATVQMLVITVAISCIYSLNIFIQPLQAGIRALIVDQCPSDQQAQASAWASRITGIGNIIGYFFGYMAVRDVLPSIHISQFAWLATVASILLLSSVALTCVFIPEPDPKTLPVPASEGKTLLKTLKYIGWSFRTMPAIVRKVCRVQFFAWMAWFPYLFYITSYVGDLYAAPLLSQDSHMSSSTKASIIEDAVRKGSFASLIFALTALATNIIIPHFTAAPVTTLSKPAITETTSYRLPICHAWAYSHFLLAFNMFTTIFVESQTQATVLVAFVGISWAFTLWVPFAIIGAEIAARQEHSVAVMAADLEPIRQDQAGAIIGIHNCAISAPQIVAALASSVIFWLAGRAGSADGIGWVFRAGGCAALVAGFLALRIRA